MSSKGAGKGVGRTAEEGVGCMSGANPARVAGEGVGCESGANPARAAGEGVDCESGANPARAAGEGVGCESGANPARAAGEGVGCESGANPAHKPMGRVVTFLTCVIDTFYIPMVGKVMPLRTFRYAVCGGGTMVLSWVVYFISYNFIVSKRFIDLGFITVSPHIAALIIVFPLSFLVGYFLNKHIAFRHSPLRDGVQFMRYALSVTGSLVLNYAFLKLFVETFHFYPTPSEVLATLIITVYSYLVQRHFTFRGSSDE